MSISCFANRLFQEFVSRTVAIRRQTTAASSRCMTSGMRAFNSWTTMVTRGSCDPRARRHTVAQHIRACVHARALQWANDLSLVLTWVRWEIVFWLSHRSVHICQNKIQWVSGCFNESLQSRLKILYCTLRTCLGIPRVAELVSEVAARRVKSRSNASGRATIVVILQGIVQAIGVLLSEVKGRVEELSARSDLETGKDSQELPHDNFVRSIHIKMMQLWQAEARTCCGWHWSRLLFCCRTRKIKLKNQNKRKIGRLKRMSAESHKQNFSISSDQPSN